LSARQVSEAESQIREAVRDFAAREIKPYVLKREWVQDPVKRVPWEMFEKAAQMNLNLLVAPEEYGGLGSSISTECFVAEEVAKADAGFAQAIGTWWGNTRLIAGAGTKEQKEWFFRMLATDNRFLLGQGNTEPAYGSDNILSYEAHHYDTTATLRDGSWVINGRKTMVSNGVVAKMYILNATTNASEPYTKSITSFLVLRDTPGITVGAEFEKLGLRMLSNCEVIFDNVKVPGSSVLGEVDRGINNRRKFLNHESLTTACYLLGCAEGAYEAALEYSKTRIQGGRPIIQHQAVGMRLARMATMIEASRSLIYRTAEEADSGRPVDPKMYTMSRYFAGELCREVSILALETFGGNGILLEMPVQKYTRDAIVCMHLVGTQDVQLLKLQALLMKP
jgi:alkylation response protein AidB-like acyl-CoA dehydrogenase